jgi:hypothetical protein
MHDGKHPLNNAAESRAPEPTFYFKHDSTSIHPATVGFMNSPIKVRSCASRLYVCTSGLGTSARTTLQIYLAGWCTYSGGSSVRISVWLLAFLTDDSLVFLSSPS